MTWAKGVSLFSEPCSEQKRALPTRPGSAFPQHRKGSVWCDSFHLMRWKAEGVMQSEWFCQGHRVDLSARGGNRALGVCYLCLDLLHGARGFSIEYCTCPLKFFKISTMCIWRMELTSGISHTRTTLVYPCHQEVSTCTSRQCRRVRFFEYSAPSPIPLHPSCSARGLIDAKVATEWGI